MQFEPSTKMTSRKLPHCWNNKARDFFKRIGLPFEIVPSYVPDPPGTFFEGVWIAGGRLIFCPARVHVSELLHEAGHLALQPRSQWDELPCGKWEEIYPPLGHYRYLGDAAVEAWDYAAALAAGIPEICLFQTGFNGNALAVWESFDARCHPGFALLRFLGMSSEWGKVDRWFVGNAAIEDTKKEALRLFMTCSKQERKYLLKAFEAAAGS